MAKKSFTKTLIFFCLISGILLTVCASSSAGEDESKNCLSCHNDTLQEGLSKIYVHTPFQQQQCPACHAADSSQEDKDNEEARRQQIKWFGRNSNRAKIHWFDFPAEKKGFTLIVETSGRKMKTMNTEIDLPKIDELQPFSNDGNAPVISKLRLASVEKGIFFSARISWETDKAATSKIIFGKDKTSLNMSSALSTQFTTQHEVILTNIKPNENYQFSAVSEDIFGNKAVSEKLPLSTYKTFANAELADQTENSSDSNIEITHELFNKNNRYMIKLSANQPVSIAIGKSPWSNKKKDSPWGDQQKGPKVVKHIVTNSKMVTTITVCYSCHSALEKGATHPVNVYPKRGMIIPPEYTTLADGRVTCMSCHADHGGNLENRLIKSSKKDLCVGCHRDML